MLWGTVCDKRGAPIAGAAVELKDERFQTVAATVSDATGQYRLETEKKRYPFLIAVKDYAVENLEYWCQDLDLTRDIRLDIRFDKLEVYGLHAFRVKGGLNPLMVYFRPMSLTKFLAGEGDIAPEIQRVEARVDGQLVPVVKINPVREVADEQEMTAYLLQLDGVVQTWNCLEISLWDPEGNFGMAAIFNH